jgi:transposase
VEGAVRTGRRSSGDACGRPSLGTAAFSLSDADAARIESAACQPPKSVGIPVTHWSASLLGEHVRTTGIEVSDRSVGRILTQAALQPHRQKMYLTSHDDEFREKRDDVLRVYYDTPADEEIICLDEKTGMQALERKYADILMRPGKPVRREFEYVRHGTLCLMGAYDVRRRKLFGFVSEDHKSETFVDLLHTVDQCYPTSKGHLICDNLSAHDTDDVWDWLLDHPQWTLHFTPKHASWLNQIECAFSILSAKVLARGSFASLDELRNAVYEYLLWFNAQNKPPFNWTYRPQSWSSS